MLNIIVPVKIKHVELPDIIYFVKSLCLKVFYDIAPYAVLRLFVPFKPGIREMEQRLLA